MARSKKTEFVCLETVETLIAQGALGEARRSLAKISPEKLARDERLEVARLARRAFYPALSVKLLNRYVRPTAHRPEKALPEEIAEYAVGLIRLGAVGEAVDLLKRLPAKQVKEAPLYFAYALFTQWNYKDSIPLLEIYLANETLDAQERITGKVNLAACLVQEERFREAARLLGEILKETSRDCFPRFHGNALELAAQLNIFNGDLDSALEALREARGFLKRTKGLDSLFVEKWEAVARLLKTNSAKNRNALKEVRKKARKMKHWETVRDCDAWFAIATGDKNIFWRAYFGTPYLHYREFLRSRAKFSVTVPPHFDRKLEGEGTPVLLELLREDGKAPLKPGHVLDRILRALCSDFYRPLRLAALFARVHPGEFYHPETSPTRMHQSLKHFRHWIARKKLPLQLLEENGSYSLKSAPGSICRLRIPSRQLEDLIPAPFRPLRTGAEEELFTAVSAMQWVKGSRRSVSRLLQHGVQLGLLETVGEGPARKYKFSANKKGPRIPKDTEGLSNNRGQINYRVVETL